MCQQALPYSASKNGATQIKRLLLGRECEFADLGSCRSPVQTSPTTAIGHIADVPVGWSNDRTGRGAVIAGGHFHRPELAESETLVGMRQLLVAHPDFTDDIEIRFVGPEHEKFAHRYRVLKNNVGDVEIVGNHHQIRGAAVFQNFLQNAFLIHFGLTLRYYARWLQILNRSRATKRKPAGVHAAAIGAGQNLPDRNAVSAEGFSDALGLLYTAR